MKAFKTMLKIDFILSLRDMNMFIFALCMPLVILVILGMIYGDKSAFDGASYSFLTQSFGSMSTIAICAGGLMGLPLVISDYRQKKILKRLQVTPASPTIILLVQMAIYAIYSVLSLISLYLVGSLFFDLEFIGSLPSFIGSYLLVMISMFSIGMMVGGIAPNMKMASTITSILYFPMLIFSGTTLPYEVMPKTVQTIADVLPLTQGVKLLKATSLGLPLQDIFVPILVMVIITVICCTISIKFFKWE
ncbi:MAG: ABC transporter permease [Coprobacillaceae bacterium]